MCLCVFILSGLVANVRLDVGSLFRLWKENVFFCSVRDLWVNVRCGSWILFCVEANFVRLTEDGLGNKGVSGRVDWICCIQI